MVTNGPRVELLIRPTGAELRYLPPSSPDMNPIDKAFSKLKAYLPKSTSECKRCYAATESDLAGM
jgi:transposase